MVRTPMKMLDKKLTYDLNVKLVANQNMREINQLSENVRIPLNILNLHRIIRNC